MHVIDRDHNGALRGGTPQRAVNSRVEGSRVERRTLGVLAQERRAERALLRFRQLAAHFVDELTEQVEEPGERQAGVGLKRSGHEHPVLPLTGGGNARLPERGLPDPGRTRENQGRREARSG